MIEAPALPVRVTVPTGERAYEIVIGSGLLGDPSIWTGLPRAAQAVIVTSSPSVASPSSMRVMTVASNSCSMLNKAGSAMPCDRSILPPPPPRRKGGRGPRA